MLGWSNGGSIVNNLLAEQATSHPDADGGGAQASSWFVDAGAAHDAQRSVAPGVAFAKQRLLRLGIILYGAKLTVAKIMGIGAAGMLADLYSVGSTLGLGLALGHWLRLDAKLTVLIATGSAICGCSAVAATQPIVQAEPHQVAAAVGTVVLCGTAAMFIYPWLYRALPWLSSDPRLMGLYTGSTVHELAAVAMGPSSCASASSSPGCCCFFTTSTASGLARARAAAGPSSTASWKPGWPGQRRRR